MYFNYCPITYNITYDYNGGSSSSSYMPDTWSVEYGNEYIPQPTRKGYIFNGWLPNDNANGNTIQYLSDLVYNENVFFDYTNTNRAATQDVTLKALWEPIKYTINLNDPLDIWIIRV